MDTKDWLLENGGYPKELNRRYTGRNLTEDDIEYYPGIKEPMLFTSIDLYSGVIRRKGKMKPEKVREEYPLATSMRYIVKSTNKTFKEIKLV